WCVGGCGGGRAPLDLLMEVEVREISAAHTLRRVLGEAASGRTATDLRGTDGSGPGADTARTVPRWQPAPACVVRDNGPGARGQAVTDRRSVRGNARASRRLHAHRCRESR